MVRGDRKSRSPISRLVRPEAASRAIRCCCGVSWPKRSGPRSVCRMPEARSSIIVRSSDGHRRRAARTPRAPPRAWCAPRSPGAGGGATRRSPAGPGRARTGRAGPFPATALRKKSSASSSDSATRARARSTWRRMRGRSDPERWVNALSTSARAWSVAPDRTPGGGQVGQHVPGQLVVRRAAVGVEQQRELVEGQRVVTVGHRGVRRRLPGAGHDPTCLFGVDRGQHGRDALARQPDVSTQGGHGALGGDGVEPVHLLAAGEGDLVALVRDRQRLVPPPALDADPGEAVERRGADVVGAAQPASVGRVGEEAERPRRSRPGPRRRHPASSPRPGP